MSSGGGGGARRVEVFDTPRGVHLDVCAGAGGLGLGLHRAGWRGTGLERDADAVRTHRARVGPCRKVDVTTAKAPHLAHLVAAGVPCQPFSLGGDQKGLDDPRGQLFRSALRIASEANARALLLENVGGMVYLGALPVVLDAFAREGWHCTATLLNAADFGTPQNRKRLFVVGFRDPADLARFRWPAPTHGAPGNLFRLPPWVTVREALGLDGGRFRKGRVEGAKGWNGQRLLDVDAPAPVVTTKTNAELLARVDAPSPCVTVGAWHQGRGRRASQRPMGELAAALEGAGLATRPATTVDARGRPSAAGHHASNKTGAVRLRPEHCALLQGFPRGFRFSGCPTSQFRQIGNAVPPQFGEALGGALWRALYGVADGG